MSRSYSVFSPKFEITSGGVRVMYGLYGWLLAKGQIAFINQHIPGSDHVAIYPEIYPPKNFTDATKVIRYVLQKPATVSAVDESGKSTLGPSEFPEYEEIYAFSRMYYDVPDDQYMFLPILNTHLFKDKKKKRTKIAFTVGKGINTQKHPEDAIVINREMAQDQKALADLLNECKVLYSYDPVSAITEIARLCGCPVILNQDWFTREEYELYEPGLDGISFDDKIEKFNSDKFREHYLGLREKFSKKLDKFIENTQK